VYSFPGFIAGAITQSRNLGIRKNGGQVVGEVGIYKRLNRPQFGLAPFKQRLQALHCRAMLVAEDKVFAVGGITGLLSESIHPKLMGVMARRASREDSGFWLKFERFQCVLQRRRKLGKNVALFGIVLHAERGGQGHSELDDQGNRVDEEVTWVSGQPDDNIGDYRE
jgi:hypothetical protein